MKNIKFRAWDRFENKMKEVKCLDFSQWWVSTDYKEGERNSFRNEETDRHFLMQFTGLWDDAGKEIYEGDIVEIQDKGETKTSYISEVYMYHDGVTVKHHPIHEALGHTGLRLLSHYCDYGDGDEYKGGYCKCKIIGNICENEDLLENK